MGGTSGAGAGNLCMNIVPSRIKHEPFIKQKGIKKKLITKVKEEFEDTKGR
jgi:hypothetical protein